MRRTDSCRLTCEEALSRMTRLCSGSEHCEAEIECKLSGYGLTNAETDKILDYLLDEKYIDNHRYARAYTLDKLRYNHWGRIKIGVMLRSQRISEADIRDAFDEIPEEEYADILRSVLSRKEHSLHDEDPYIRRGKLIRFAMQRGFEMDEISKILPDF